MLIRGPSGSGKSTLAWDLMQAAAQGVLPFARLVADDRVCVEAHAGRLLVRPAENLAGMLEIHGLGIRRLPYEQVAAVGLVVDLAAADAARLPGLEAGKTSISGISLPRLAVAAWRGALPHPSFPRHGGGGRLTSAQVRYVRALDPAGIINHNGTRIAPAETDIRALLWPLLSAVQQSAYIAKAALAMGLRMGVNVRPFVRCSEAPARSSG